MNDFEAGKSHLAERMKKEPDFLTRSMQEKRKREEKEKAIHDTTAKETELKTEVEHEHDIDKHHKKPEYELVFRTGLKNNPRFLAEFQAHLPTKNKNLKVLADASFFNTRVTNGHHSSTLPETSPHKIHSSPEPTMDHMGEVDPAISGLLGVLVVDQKGNFSFGAGAGITSKPKEGKIKPEFLLTGTLKKGQFDLSGLLAGPGERADNAYVSYRLPGDKVAVAAGVDSLHGNKPVVQVRAKLSMFKIPGNGTGIITISPVNQGGVSISGGLEFRFGH